MLAPDVQTALLQGTAPVKLDPDQSPSREIPLDWDEQCRLLGMSA